MVLTNTQRIKALEDWRKVADADLAELNTRLLALESAPPDPDPDPEPPPPSTYPDASTTGVPTGMALTTVPGGSYTITSSVAATLPTMTIGGATYRIFEKKLVTGMLTIEVPYVLARYCKVLGNPYYAIWSPADHTIVEECDIGPDSGTTTEHVDYCLSFENFGTARKVDCHRGIVGIKVRNNGIIEDSYIHEGWQQAGDHCAGINSPQGNNGIVRRCNIDGLTIPSGGRVHNGLSVYTDRGPSTNWLVEDNRFNHNGYHIFCDVIAPFIVRRNLLTTDFERTPNLKDYFFSNQSGYTFTENHNELGTLITR